MQNVDMMERSEVVSSAASGSFGPEQTENDDTLSEGVSEDDTLNLVECAILRTLKRYSSQQDDGGSPERDSENAKTVEGTRLRGRFNSAGDEEQHLAGSVHGPPARSSNPDDTELLANLLEQVHSLRRNQRHGCRRPKDTLPTELQDTPKPARRRGKEKKLSSTEELRMTLEAAAVAAKAAADAATAAAISVERNTVAINCILKSMKPSKKRKKTKKAKADVEKEIFKGNHITHWILGFTAVTTIAWRIGVVKAVKHVTSKFGDPLGYVGKLVGGNDEELKEKSKEKPPEKKKLLDKLPHVDLPSILSNDSDHKDSKSASGKNARDDKETNILAKSANAVDVKTKIVSKEIEKTAFSFANFLQAKPNEK